MTWRQKALCVSCWSLIVIFLIFLWVRIGLMGCHCPRQFDHHNCEYDYSTDQTRCECLCDGNFFTCEYTCPGCVSWEPFTGVILFGDEGDDPNKMPQAGCCWGEDGSWGSDKEREGCSIQYCGQAPCDGQDVRDAKNTHWTQHPLDAMEVMWPVLLPFALIACVCYAHRRQRGRGPTDAAPTPAAAPSPALGAQEVGETVEEESEGEAEADPGSAPDPVLQGLNVLLSFFEEESEGERPTRAPQHCDT